MSLNFNLKEVENHKELYLEDGYMKVPVYQIGILEDDEHYWVPEGDDYRAATDMEVTAAREGKVTLYTRAVRLNGLTNTLIWISVPVGIQKITKENVDEFFRRVQEIEKDGAWMNTPDGPAYFTRQDIVRHIGLGTNVTPVTKRTFDARMREAEKKRREGART